GGTGVTPVKSGVAPDLGDRVGMKSALSNEGGNRASEVSGGTPETTGWKPGPPFYQLKSIHGLRFVISQLASNPCRTSGIGRVCRKSLRDASGRCKAVWPPASPRNSSG